MPIPSRDLVFARGRLAGSPTPLVFGTGDAAIITPTTVEVGVRLAGSVNVVVLVLQPLTVTVAVRLSGTVSVVAAVVAPTTVQMRAQLSGSVDVNARGGWAEISSSGTSRDLVFRQTVITGSPTNLVFGNGDLSLILPVKANVAVRLPDSVTVNARLAPFIRASAAAILAGEVTVSARVMQPVLASCAVQLAGSVTVEVLAGVPVRAEGMVLLSGEVTVGVSGFYDNRVIPYLEQNCLGEYNVAVPNVIALDSGWNVSQQALPEKSLPWTKADVTDQPLAIPHSLGIGFSQAVSPGHQVAVKNAIQVGSVHETALQVRTITSLVHDTALPISLKAAAPSQTGVFQEKPYVATWQWAQSKVRHLTAPSGASTVYRGVQGLSFPWQLAMHPRHGKSVLPAIPAVAPITYPRDGHLLFECPPLAAANLIFGAHACFFPPVLNGTVIVPIRRAYMIFNNASLRRVDGNIALPVFSMSLSLDADSWTWSFSAAMPGTALPNLEPSASGAPVEVEAVINGVAYRALVERIGRERSFGRNDLRVSGRGKTALLDSPYAPSRNFTNPEARTAQQLMGDVLSLNGVPMDWAVDWGLTDWLVPAGVFSHQGSYISALNTIAAAAGGYVQPHASLQTLRILPRYPSAPWDWDSVTPDVSLPSDVTTREGIEWVERARYNRVFVSGQQSGVLGQVTRAGTAGDLLAPMVTDALITTPAVARQRGISILANTGRQAELSLRLPVLAETGVITPGKFVQYLDAGVVRRGLVRSTGVEVGMPEIWQTLGVQTYA